jgi:CheY-like chemotaxis protein
MPTCLYIEDDVYSQEVMKLMMVDVLGFQDLIIFEDSANLEERLAQLPSTPDIIFVDIHMKPIDGFQILGILRHLSRFENTPIVALTASVMNEEVQMLREASFNGAIAKPIDSDAFPEALKRIMCGEEVWRIIF